VGVLKILGYGHGYAILGMGDCGLKKCVFNLNSLSVILSQSFQERSGVGTSSLDTMGCSIILGAVLFEEQCSLGVSKILG